MLEDFLHRFKTLVDTLMAHPQIRVTHLWIGPPATGEQLRGLAKTWGGHVPAAIETLYRQANGIQLRWIDALCETYDPARDDVMRFEAPADELYSEPGEYVGLLDLRSCDELAAQESVGWQFDLTDDPLCGAMVLENYGESEDAVIYFENAPDDPWIGVGEDHLAVVGPPGTQTLSQYLERLVATWASTEHRIREYGTKPPPKAVGELLLRRVTLDPTRLIGERVMFRDQCLIHGRVLGLADVVNAPMRLWHAPTFAEVETDLGETVHVPLRALYPTDTADGYERLRSDPPALRARLQGAAVPMFEDLAAAAGHSHVSGFAGGPAVYGAADCFVGLTRVFEPLEAVRLLLDAAHTLHSHPQANVAQPVPWPTTRPRDARGPIAAMRSLAAVMFDAAAVVMARQAPQDLGSWLGHETTALLRRILQGYKTRDPLRGSNPLNDPSKTCGFISAALQGGPTGFETHRPANERGSSLGLSDFRVVGS